MGVQRVADPDQALGLAVARMIRTRAFTKCAQSTAVRRAVALAVCHGPSGSTNIQRVQVTRHVFIVVGGGMARTRRLRRTLVGPQRFGLFVPADHRIARIIGMAVEVQPRFHRGHERRLAHRRIAALHPPLEHQFVLFNVRRTVSYLISVTTARSSHA